MTESEYAKKWAMHANRSAEFAARDAAIAADELAGGPTKQAANAINRSREWAEHILWCLDHAVVWAKRMEATEAEEKYLADKGPIK